LITNGVNGAGCWNRTNHANGDGFTGRFPTLGNIQQNYLNSMCTISLSFKKEKSISKSSSFIFFLSSFIMAHFSWFFKTMYGVDLDVSINFTGPPQLLFFIFSSVPLARFELATLALEVLRSFH
jgi:hypothetical protein